MAGFSSASFSTGALSVLAFDFGGTPPPAKIVGGHFGDDYRKHLKRLEEITRTKDLTPAIVKAAQELDVPVDTPEISKIAANPNAIEVMAIDYGALADELKAIQSYLDNLSVYGELYYDYLQEQDDEIALLLMIN